MDKFSYSIGLGIGQNLSSMGIGNLAVDDFAQAIKDVLEGNQTAISHNEAREIVNKYFEELESKMSAVAIEQGQAFLEENKKGPGVVVLPSGLQYEIIKEGTGKKPKATDQVRCHYEGTLIDGTLFDSSIQRGEPAVFGVNQVIPGWVEAFGFLPVPSLMISYCSPLGRTTTPGPFLFSSRKACPCSIATTPILVSSSSKYLFTISRASLWLIAV